MIDQLKPLLGKLALFSQERLGFKNPPKLFLRNDSQNSQQVLGKTAFYNPEEQSVTLFIHGRHPKDILRSFTHELVHHCQNERGDLSPDKMTAQGPGYAQECPHMRKMEQEAYLEGSMCFRDWEDTIEDKDLILIKLAESKFLKENKTMTTKITKDFLKETIRKVVQQVLKEGPQVMTKKSPKYKEAEQMISSIAAARNGSTDKKASLEQFAADMLKNQPEQLQAFNDALNIVNMVKNPKLLAFSQDDYINRQANAYYTSLSSGTPENQLANKRDALLKRALGQGVTGDLNSGLDATAAQGNGLVNAQDAAAIHAAISTFARAGDKVMAAPVVRTKAAAPAPSPTQPSIDGAIASAEPTIGMGGGTIPTPVVKPQKPVAGGGATSSRQDVRRKRAQQVRILNRNALPGLAGVNNIKQLQQRLVDAGYADATLPNGRPFVDGDYGDASQKAMMKLQKDIGAGPDGVMGTGTYQKLLGYTQQNPESKANIFFKGPAAASAERPMRNYLARENNEPKEAPIKVSNSGPKTEKEYQAQDAKDLDKELAQIRQQRRNNAKDTVAQNPKEGIDLDESNCGKRKDGKPCGNKKCKTCYPMEEGKLPDEKKCPNCNAKTEMKEGKEVCSSCDAMITEKDGKRTSDCKCEKKSEKAEGGFPDLTGDGQITQADILKGRGVELAEDSKVQTPEQENSLYEQRFATKNNRLFEKLVKEWTK